MIGFLIFLFSFPFFVCGFSGSLFQDTDFLQASIPDDVSLGSKKGRKCGGICEIM